MLSRVISGWTLLSIPLHEKSIAHRTRCPHHAEIRKLKKMLSCCVSRLIGCKSVIINNHEGRPKFDKGKECIKCKTKTGNIVIRYAVYCKYVIIICRMNALMCFLESVSFQ
jgi:hypothetical protein